MGEIIKTFDAVEKPRHYADYDIKICPRCENTVHSIYNYCCHCGQRFERCEKPNGNNN